MAEGKSQVEPEYLPVYYDAARALEAGGVPSLLGGGLMVGFYGRSRPTKDIDFFIRPADRTRALDVLAADGFFTCETEKSWLLKAEKAGAPVDLIVHSGAMYDLDAQCLAHARVVTLGGYPFRGFGPEDLLLRKIYTWQEGRPDWWDAVSMVAGAGMEMDWPYFLGRIPADSPGRALSFLLFAHSYLAEERVPWSAIQELGGRHFLAGEPLPRGRVPAGSTLVYITGEPEAGGEQVPHGDNSNHPLQERGELPP